MASITLPAGVRQVIVCGDNDRSGVGQAAAKALAERAAGMGKVARVAIPARAGADWNDVLRSGMSRREMRRLIRRAPKIEAATFEAIDDRSFAALEFPPREMLLGPWLPAGSSAMVHGYRGTGKTYMALGIAHAVAYGGSLLDWRCPKRRDVLLLDGEMAAADLQARIRLFRSQIDQSTPGRIRILTPDLLPPDVSVPDLTTEAGQQLVDRLVTNDTGLIIVDSLSTLCRSGTENEAESWGAVWQWQQQHRREGRTVLFVHHEGKTGKQRGTSKKEDTLESVVRLVRPRGHQPQDGAVFEVRFEKSRGFAGEAAKSFLARMKIEDGKISFTRSSIPAGNRVRALGLLASGMGVREVARELGIDHAQISRWNNTGQDGAKPRKRLLN